MAESSSHNTSSPEITPKKELVTLDKPESPNLFLPITQAEFTFKDIAFTTNNEVALLYPSHPNQEYFKDVSDFISKCCLKEAFTRAPTQYKEYLSEFWYTTKTLEDSKVWLSTPTGGVRGDIDATRTMSNISSTLIKLMCHSMNISQLGVEEVEVVYVSPLRRWRWNGSCPTSCHKKPLSGMSEIVVKHGLNE
ncbi:hypothetical protein Tco_0764482 [Tanacetum coccineum]